MFKVPVSLLIVVCCWLAPLSALGQVPRKTTVASSKTVAAKCSGAWTGTVSYTRTQSQSDNKTVERVSARGQDTRNWNMNYNYHAQVALVESPKKDGSSVAKASINHTMTSVETIEAVEKNSCDRGKSWRDMRGSSTSRTETTGNAGGVEANVNVGVNEDGTYSVSVGLPQIRGKVSGSQTSSFSGQCTAKEGKNTSLPPTEISIDGQSLTSDGTTKVDPADPYKLSGGYSLNLPGGVTETITWNLQKCGAPLRITDVKFEQMKFPNWDDWQEVTEQVGTIDGNWVKVKATVLNASGDDRDAEVSFKETYKGDKWDGAKPDMPLKDNTVNVRLEPGESRDVEILWDTSGYSWYDDGRPRLVQRVKAELWEKNKLVSDMTKNLKVAPKPLILVHGLWSSWKAWETWQNILTTSHSYGWKAFPVGEVPSKGVMNTGGEFLSTTPTNSIADNARELERYIKYAQEDRNAWHVDIVAHSMGGLISRYYIDQIMPAPLPEGRPKVEHLVMLGTPNMGSPCADVMDLAFEALGKQVEAVRQLRTDYVENFNKVHTQRKGVKFSALAGNPLPTMCKQVVWNDGVVSVPSAKWIIADNAESKSIHTDLTGTADFSSFVKPRLAVGPKGDHNPEAPAQAGASGGFSLYRPALETGLAPVTEARSFGPNAGDSSFTLDTPFAKEVRLGPKQSAEIEIPVDAAANFGMTFMAHPLISATLIDDKGAVTGKNLANSGEAKGMFRSIFVDHAVSSGTWKLRLENTGSVEYIVIVTTWKNAVK